jgi:hypothetical protein
VGPLPDHSSRRAFPNMLWPLGARPLSSPPWAFPFSFAASTCQGMHRDGIAILDKQGEVGPKLTPRACRPLEAMQPCCTARDG